jgi:hypothetical protein
LATAGVTAGVIVTPFAAHLFGRALLAGRPGYGEQSVGLGLFFYGVLAALPSGVFWGISALWIGGGAPFEQVGRHKVSFVAAACAIAVVAYGACIVAVILAAWLTFFPRLPPAG